MGSLKEAAAEVVATLDAARRAVEAYYSIARKVGLDSPEGATARGLDASQLQRRLQAEVIYRLSPLRDSVLQFDGAPQARHFAAAKPLLGLAGAV